MKKLSILTAGIFMMLTLTIATITSCTDPCKDVNCSDPNGTCVEGVCNCETGYEGDDCSVEVRTKFIASWNSSDVCTSGTYAYTATITTSSTGVTKVVITNFGGFGGTFVLTADISGSTISIANQTVSGITFSSATGSINSDGTQITWTYGADDGTTLDNCNGTWTKI